ncbi:hypothetical protein EW145_g5417 [Phellinidium pouzarii]|uniref:FAS1 domain-containing protein n=1 Tax=Phellinidium pouzarii TaxID=167371 RepID=A0A4S4L4U4_9AGAM|nr:hypothetical protein EW145_g5417 [Phellinidium pouzarii]
MYASSARINAANTSWSSSNLPPSSLPLLCLMHFLCLSALAVLAAPAVAQNVTFLTDLLQELVSLNLTSLANASTAVNSTSTGLRLLDTIGNGPQTIFAPNNDAWAGAHPNITTNAELLAEVLSYHVVPGTFNVTSSFPNTTVGRTLFNGSDLVFLEGGKSQVLAWSNESGTVHILNQNTPVTVLNSTTFGNLTLHVTSAVIDVPGDFEAALFANNLSSFSSALQTASLLDTLNTMHGVTIFAPTNAAIAAVQQNLTAAGSNSTILTDILLNHVIYGKSVYTGDLIALRHGSNETTAAGEGLSATFNSTGGVSSASAAATASSSESGPIGFTPSATSPSGPGVGAGASGSSSASMGRTDLLVVPLSAGLVSILGFVLGGILVL